MQYLKKSERMSKTFMMKNPKTYVKAESDPVLIPPHLASPSSVPAGKLALQEQVANIRAGVCQLDFLKHYTEILFI